MIIKNNKTAVFLAGTARSHMLMLVIHLHSGGINYNGETLVTLTQCTGKYIMYTRSLAICYVQICYARRQAKICGQTYIDRLGQNY